MSERCKPHRTLADDQFETCEVDCQMPNHRQMIMEHKPSTGPGLEFIQ